MWTRVGWRKHKFNYIRQGANVASRVGTLAPPGKYDRIVRLRRRCGPVSNYFNHLLIVINDKSQDSVAAFEIWRDFKSIKLLQTRTECFRWKKFSNLVNIWSSFEQEGWLSHSHALGCASMGYLVKRWRTRPLYDTRKTVIVVKPWFNAKIKFLKQFLNILVFLGVITSEMIYGAMLK